jgi:hypothetical protein
MHAGRAKLHMFRIRSQPHRATGAQTCAAVILVGGAGSCGLKKVGTDLLATIRPSLRPETSDTCATRSRQCCADCLLGWALLHGPCVPRTGRPSPVAFSYKLPACVLVAWLLAAQCRPACSCWAFSAAPQALQCCFTPPPQSRTPPPPRLPGISCGKLSTTSPLWET